MNQIVKTSTPGEIMETVLIKGDLSKLTVDERNVYYFKLCESVGLNPLTQPIEYINLNGKLRLYAKKDCTDQLRSIHKVSVTDMSETERDGVYIVTSKVANAEGRTDMAKGAVNIKGLVGEALANAIMKAETKSKRRATLSICGLGILDETEVDDIPANQKAPVPSPPRAIASGPAQSTVIVHVQPFFLPTTNRKFEEWAAVYRSHISVAANLGEIQKWDSLNNTALDAINEQMPALYLAIDAAVAKRMAELGTPTEKPAATKPAVPSPATIDEAIEHRMDDGRKTDPITSGTPPKAKRDGMPDIETEYDGWFSYCLDRISHADDGGSLETFFNDEVEAFRDKIFPSDLTDLAEAYGKAQAKLNADE